MNYEEAYKKALALGREIYGKYKITGNEASAELIARIFPELKESEGERIRKTLIGWINLEPSNSFEWGFTKEQILAWLEKQKESSHVPETCKENGNFFTDEQKVTWRSIEHKMMKEKIQRLIEKDEDSTTFDERRKMIEWLNNLEPAKWSKEDEKMVKIIVHFLQQYRKITHYPGNSQIGIDMAISWLKSLRPQSKHEWSEEDEKMLNACIEAVGSASIRGDVKNLRNWLKSLRPQSHWKPSKEQMEALSAAYNEAYEYRESNDVPHRILLSLYDDLKKLM